MVARNERGTDEAPLRSANEGRETQHGRTFFDPRTRDSPELAAIRRWIEDSRPEQNRTPFDKADALLRMVDRLSERNRKLVGLIEKTAKRFDAMKFSDFAAELRAAIEENDE